ncbi:MAG: alpha/beta hydrolase, partial [Hymenobacteraceae bacterium]|nr:alpha/beta hydrolase [Hymenobacteraceae bacterium]
MISKILSDAGTGEAIVFLHGFCESKEIWSNFKKPLQQQFRTIAIDLQGFGNNTGSSQNYSMEAQADFVQAQLKELRVKKCLLVGHS